MSTKPKELPIETWLKMLPEPYRSQALENLKKHGWDNDDQEEESADDALSLAFDWETSLQGYEYWNELYEKLFDGKVNLQSDIWFEIRQELAELNDEILKIKEQLNQE